MIAMDDVAEPLSRIGRFRAGRRRSGPPAVTVLDRGRHIAAGLRDGLAGPGAAGAASGLCSLLDARAVGFAGLHGEISWSRPAGSLQERAAALVDTALHHDKVAGRGGTMRAVPVHVRGQVVGVMVVEGDIGTTALRETAAWVGDALERGRLEASAKAAEQAELNALRAEMSPHFVYNALTTIASFVRTDPELAHELMLDFADYTRHSLGRHGDYTTLAGEFRAVEAYLTLARAQLGSRLRVQVSIAPEVLSVSVPYLVLQPLVENAVQHGVERPGGQGHVQVRGAAEGSECVITIEDDGPGMDPDDVRDILASRGRPASVGLVNVDRRLRTVYGAHYGLVVETALGAGTRVVMRFPRFQPGVVAR